MADITVLASYLITYGAIVGYAAWLLRRHRRATRPE